MKEEPQPQELPANEGELGYGALPDVGLTGAGASPETAANWYMYCYKVLLCPKRYSHDWGICPYAHYKENARRRDPQRYRYSSCFCPNAARGQCPAGLQCPYAHGLFEYWLHPLRFRTQMCKSGQDCRRSLCFFAHTAAELRMPTSGYRGDSNASSSSNNLQQQQEQQQRPVMAELQQPAQGLMLQDRPPLQVHFAAPQLQPQSSQSAAMPPSSLLATAVPSQQAGSSSRGSNAFQQLGNGGVSHHAGCYIPQPGIFHLAQAEQQQPPPQLVHMPSAPQLREPQQSHQLQQVLLQGGAGVPANAGHTPTVAANAHFNGFMAVPGMQVPGSNSNQAALVPDRSTVLMNFSPNFNQPDDCQAALLAGLQAMLLHETQNQQQQYTVLSRVSADVAPGAGGLAPSAEAQIMLSSVPGLPLAANQGNLGTTEGGGSTLQYVLRTESAPGTG